MKKVVKATVVWPVTLQIQVEYDISDEDLDEAILDAAANILDCNTIKPVIKETTIIESENDE